MQISKKALRERERERVLTYMMKETIPFCEIDDVDPDSFSEFSWIFHSEVEPLQIAITIGVISHPTVKSRHIFHSNLVQIGAFKVSIKRDLRFNSVVEGNLLALSIGNMRSDSSISDIDRLLEILCWS